MDPKTADAQIEIDRANKKKKKERKKAEKDAAAAEFEKRALSADTTNYKTYSPQKVLGKN